MTTSSPQYKVDINDVINELKATPEGAVQWELAQLRAIAQDQFRQIEEQKSHIEKLQSAIAESEPTV